MARTGRPVQVYLSDDMVERLRAVAERNRRTMTAEIEAAIIRYLAAPDVVAPGPVEPQPEPLPRRPRGRPRKTPAPPATPAPEVVPTLGSGKAARKPRKKAKEG